MKSRTQNATYNTAVGLIVQILTIVLSFVERRIFVDFLSLDYLGVNGLFSNILSLLALSELGVSSVVVFYLYKPVYEQNIPAINSIINYFKKVYWIIATVMLGLGLAIIPILPLIVKSEFDFKHLTFYYIIFLLNSVVTIPIAPKLSLLAANQNQRLQKNITLLFKVFLSVAHILVLYLTHNFTYYLVATLASTILTQITLSKIVDKKYNYLRKSNHNINLINKQEIKEKIKSVMLCKLGATIINSTDNILISVLVSTIAVGKYSNYATITGALMAFISVLNGSISSGIGNLSAENNKERMFQLFKVFLYIYQVIGVFCALCFFFLSKDFIIWWLGKDYVLETGIVITIAARLWIYSIDVPVWTYRDANGLFEKAKYIMLVNAGINLAFSIILGKHYGILGIIAATSIADLLTTYIYDPYIIYKFLFKKSLSDFFISKIRYILLALVSVVLCYLVLNNLPHSFFFIFVRLLLISTIVFGTYFLGMIKTDENKELIRLFKRLIRK